MPPDKRSGPRRVPRLRRAAHLASTPLDSASSVRRTSANVIELRDLHPRHLAAWRAARAHLLAHGIWPMVPPAVERALKRRGWWAQ